MQRPSLGRIVLFNQPGKQPAPAIITRVWSDFTVNLTVFQDATETAAKTSIEYAEPGDEAGRDSTWFWPPRV